jgi:hypothetical protein
MNNFTANMPPFIPTDSILLEPHYIKQIGDKFWTGNDWTLCSQFGAAVGNLNYVIRQKDIGTIPIISTKEKVQKYLKKQSNKLK